MPNKTKIVRDYLNNIGTKNQLFFLFGNTPTENLSNTSDSSIDVWQNSDLAFKIARKDTVAVIPNITWASGNVYDYWSSNASNSGQYYAWNKSNGIVYLCTSNNSLNRTDLSKTSLSNQAPSHSYGQQTYSDGYTWVALYKITADLLRFVSSNWIPVISFDDYRTNETSRYTRAQSFCSNNQGLSGYCGVYTKLGAQIPATSNTFTTYGAGELVSYFSSTCKDCYYLFENNESFITSFSTGLPSSTIDASDNYDLIGSLISRNSISLSSAYYALYDISENGLDDGAIVSLLLDLSNFTDEDLVVTEPNPELTITSNTGSDAIARFKTYTNLDGEYIINGIEIISNGSGYKDASISINSNKFVYLTSLEVDSLIESIDIHLDHIDGLNFDPISALGTENVLFDVRIETNNLNQEGIVIPDEINFYGLVENPLEEINDSTTIVAGSQYGKDLSYSESTVVKVEMKPTFIPTLSTGNVTGSTTTGRSLSRLSVTKVEPSGAVYNASIKGARYQDISNLDTITIDSVVYGVKEVVETPVFKQYSGKVTQTKKLDSPLTFGNTDTDSKNTKIFRINIVKGF
jgi:hypothetical protein